MVRRRIGWLSMVTAAATLCLFAIANTSSAENVKPQLKLIRQQDTISVSGSYFTPSSQVQIEVTASASKGSGWVTASTSGDIAARLGTGSQTSQSIRVTARDISGTVATATLAPINDNTNNTKTRFFGPNSAFNTPIGPNPTIANNSKAIVERWLAPQPFYANTMDWGRTFYRSTASDPSYKVGVDMAPQWGPDPFVASISTRNGNESCNPLHIPEAARIPTGTDRWVIIADATKPGIYCELWATTHKGSVWHASFGSVFTVAGNGTQAAAGGGTGAGISALAGLITFDDVKSGVIDHALVFPGACNSKNFIPPATKSDGTCNKTPAMSTGMRFQLDPAFDCTGTDVKIEKMICIALQKYGAIDGDMTGQSGTIANALYFQTDDLTDPARKSSSKPGDPTRTGALFAQVGLTGDYQKFGNIPMNRLRLLESTG